MMAISPLVNRDPRTVARDIPGICDTLFPQIVPGVVKHFNLNAYQVQGCSDIPHHLVAASSLQHAMLFEIAIAAGEQQLAGSTSVDMDKALSVAIARQRRHFDAKLPEKITDVDREIIVRVAENLTRMASDVSNRLGNEIVRAPHIPGYQWISSGSGDFGCGQQLIEVKCTNKIFSSSDYRQVMMYWLLSYASAIEGKGEEWAGAILVNPRLNVVVEISFERMIQVVGAGRSKVDILELFSSMVADHINRTAL
jgi:hypothetical protein